MGKTLLGVALATLAMYVFSAAFWMSPLPYGAIQSTPLDGSVQEALSETFPDSGTYLVPGYSEDLDRVGELHEAGPLGVVHVDLQGRPMGAPSVYAAGFLHQFALVAVLAGLMSIARPSLISYGRRLKFVAVASLLMALPIFGSAIWWYVPLPWLVVNAVFVFASLLVAGAVLAGFIKPAVESA